MWVLGSHHHKDHLSPNVFGLCNRVQNKSYIVSKDIEHFSGFRWNPSSSYRGFYVVPVDSVSVLGLSEVYKDRNIRITAYGSTDIGNSYVIEAGHYTVFFAGDLNAWTWRSKNTLEEAETMKDRFCAILDEIRFRYDRFDVVLFPVDPRMGTDATEGARLFCHRFNVKYFIPMHFELWENKFIQSKFRSKVASCGGEIGISADGRYIPLVNEGEKLELNNRSDFQ